MYDSEDLRNFTSEFLKRSLEVGNLPLIISVLSGIFIRLLPYRQSSIYKITKIASVLSKRNTLDSLQCMYIVSFMILIVYNKQWTGFISLVSVSRSV